MAAGKDGDGMGRLLAMFAIMATALVLGGCASKNFIVFKDGRSFFITSEDAERKRILCGSPDMANIVKDSGLPATLQDALQEGICSFRQGARPLRSTLEGMTDEQLSALKRAFRKNGYEINLVADG